LKGKKQDEQAHPAEGDSREEKAIARSSQIDLALNPSAPILLRIGALVKHSAIGKCEFASELVDLAINDPNENIRAQAVIALSPCQSIEVIRILGKILSEDPHVHVRCSAAIVLGTRRSEVSVKFLLHKLHDSRESFHVWAYCIRSLASLNLDSALVGMKAILSDQEAPLDVRNCCQIALNLTKKLGGQQTDSHIDPWDKATAFQKILGRAMKGTQREKR
jgi:HEAT repeat protein